MHYYYYFINIFSQYQQLFRSCSYSKYVTKNETDIEK